VVSLTELGRDAGVKENLCNAYSCCALRHDLFLQGPPPVNALGAGSLQSVPKRVAVARPDHTLGPLGFLQGKADTHRTYGTLATQSTFADPWARWSLSGWGGALRGLFAPPRYRSEGPRGVDEPKRPQGLLRDPGRLAEKGFALPLVGSGQPIKRASESPRSPGGHLRAPVVGQWVNPWCRRWHSGLLPASAPLTPLAPLGRHRPTCAPIARGVPKDPRGGGCRGQPPMPPSVRQRRPLPESPAAQS
jgi:hypothetical protein